MLPASSGLCVGRAFVLVASTYHETRSTWKTGRDDRYDGYDWYEERTNAGHPFLIEDGQAKPRSTYPSYSMTAATRAPASTRR
jgi:hypothetical protein